MRWDKHLFSKKYASLMASALLAFFTACSNAVDSDEYEESSSSICKDCTDKKSSSSSKKTSSSSKKKSESSSSKKTSSSSKALSSSSEKSSSSRMGLPPCRTADGSKDDCEYGEFTDERDGQVYKTVKIGTQTWMAENLRYNTGASCAVFDDYKCCHGELLYCGEKFYSSTAASTACPPGWHLPSRDEFDTLINAVGGPSEAAYSLKSTSGWLDWKGTDKNGSDGYGFNAKAVGVDQFLEPDGTVGFGPGMETCFKVQWGGDCLELTISDNEIHNTSIIWGGSVRCLLGDTGPFFSRIPPCRTDSSDNCEYGTLTDTRDNQTYKTVKIGEQIWMAQNLNYKTDSSFCKKDEDADKETNCTKFGRLYLWNEAVEKDICPEGWHVPSQTEFDTLVSAVGGKNLAGLYLKATTDWDSFDLNEGIGKDSYGFAALAASHRYYTGFFSPGETFTYFWSSSKSDYKTKKDTTAYAYALNMDNQTDAAELTSSRIDNANSVRCLKD